MSLTIFKFLFRIYYFVFSFKLFKSKKDKHTVIYFNTHDKGGGAAKICSQLFSYFKNSNMYVLVKRTKENKIYSFDPNLWSRLGQYAREIEKKYGLIDFSKLGLIHLINDTKFQKAQIIHLHNTHGYYMSFLAMEKVFSSKKVIWTLHDDYMITGHCSFSMTCNKWIEGCKACPDLTIYPSLDFDSTKINQIQKKHLFQKIQPFIVTPSKWLEERIRLKYPFLKNVTTIYNGVNTELFYPIKDRISLRNKYEISIEKKVFLFVAELSTNNPFKGGEIIRTILENELPENWLLITVGDKNVISINDKHLSFPYINSDSFLNELYNLADIMIYPTKADNLPLVVIESMSCGVPVIASNIGGVNEIISDEEDGFLINEFKLESYYNALKKYFELSEYEKNEISNNARNKILKHFDQSIMLESYSRLYNKVLN